MLINDFNIGPFIIRPAGRMQIGGEAKQLLNIDYGSRSEREGVAVKPGTQAQVTEQVMETIGEIILELRREHERSHTIYLVNAGGEHLADFEIDGYVLPGMTSGLIDDRSSYWLRSADRKYSQAVTLNEYAHLRTRHERPAMAWIADFFDVEVLSTDITEWRAPGEWHLRHVVGIGSLTGISGAKAAALVGVNPSSFRKYTASEGSKNRQAMSFAMWHLLLHRLGIQRLPEGWS